MAPNGGSNEHFQIENSRNYTVQYTWFSLNYTKKSVKRVHITRVVIVIIFKFLHAMVAVVIAGQLHLRTANREPRNS